MGKNTEGNILVKCENNIGFLQLDNAKKLNAISLSMWEKLCVILENFSKNSSIRCLAISGAGDKAFSAGADISEFEDKRSDPQSIKNYEKTSKDAMTLLQNFSKPTIASINGYCMGGGLALALSCDIRIASENSTFGIPAAKLGLAYSYNGIKRLTSIVGPSRAKYIFFTADKFNARQAKEYGILEEVFAKKEIVAQSKKLVTSIAKNAPLTVKSAKMAIDSDPNDKRYIEKCIKAEQDCFSSKDYAEGKKAFIEKRKPLFRGN